MPARNALYFLLAVLGARAVFHADVVRFDTSAHTVRLAGSFEVHRFG
jgi:hypothetical protein